jgi:hypothetical protein
MLLSLNEALFVNINSIMPPDILSRNEYAPKTKAPLDPLSPITSLMSVMPVLSVMAYATPTNGAIA